MLLFYRVGKQAKLPNIGTELKKKTDDLFTNIDKITHFLKKVNHRLEDTVNIGSSVPEVLTNISTYIIENNIAKINVFTNNSRDTQYPLKNNKLDLTIIAGDVKDEEIQSAKLYSDHLIFFIAKQNTLATTEYPNIDQLAKQHVFIRNKSSIPRKLFDKLIRKNKLQLNNLTEINYKEGIFEMVKLDMGIGIAISGDVQKVDSIQIIDFFDQDGMINMPNIDINRLFHKNSNTPTC